MEFWTEPFGTYQREGWERTKDAPTWAYFWEQGLGKSWLAINVARAAYEAGKIDALLITAPNGVHAAWVTDQLPKHLPPDFPWEAMIWWPSVARNYWPEVRTQLREFVEQNDRLLILSTSYHAFLQKRSVAVVAQFLKRRRVMWVLDESDDIGSPGAKWTRRILRLGPLAVMRRIGTGTPYKDGTPLAYWSQFEFLHPKILGLPWKAFKLHYAEWYFRPLPGRPYDAMVPKKDFKTGRQIFKNLDELEAKISVRALRMSKEEAGLNLPPKLYDKIIVEMSPRQSALYDRVRDEAILDLGEERGERIIELVMIRRLRLQQIACGFLPRDGEEPEQVIGGGLPRLDQAIEAIRKAPGQVIVWARFRMDIDLLFSELAGVETVGRYDGRTPEREREPRLKDFLDGNIRLLVANQASLSRGHTFVNSHRAFFYSNYEKLLLRVQAEDRQHRIGTHNPVLYTDVLVGGSVDEVTVSALRNKMDVADYLSGRPRKEWL